MSTGKKILIFLVVLLVAGGLIAFGVYNASRQQSATGIPKNAIPVQLENAHRETIVSRVSAKGSVELADKTTVYPETQARIKQVNVKAGDEVTAGDILLIYDTQALESYRDQLADAELALRSAELALESSRIPPTKTELLQAETQVKQAENTITDIDAQVRQIDLSLVQLSVSIEAAINKVNDTQSLHEQGIVTKTELDNARDALKNLENQLETTQSQRETALLGLPMAQENVRLAKAQYDALANRLKDPKSINQIASQEIAVEQAKLRITQIEKNIADFKPEETAPLSGTVITLYAAEGDVSTSGRALLEIADTSNRNLVIRINVPESDAKNIETGQSVDIKGAALGTDVYNGHISKIHPLAEKKQIGNAMETVLTVEIMPDSDILLRAGYTIDTSIITGTAEDTLVVPLMSTMSDEDGGHFVYIMNEDYSVEKRPVILGEYSGIYVQAAGVTEEDRIILNPSSQIKEGVYVKPIA